MASGLLPSVLSMCEVAIRAVLVEYQQPSRDYDVSLLPEFLELVLQYLLLLEDFSDGIACLVHPIHQLLIQINNEQEGRL